MAGQRDDEAPVRVYIDLIGDLFHWGDVRLLERARAAGDVLVVGVIGDDDAEAASHRPVATLAERVAVIAACRHVDEVIPGAPLTPDLAFLDRYDIDHVCLADDFDFVPRRQAFAALLDTDRAIVLPAEKEISTGDFVQRIVGRGEAGPPLPAPRSLSYGPHIHAPPAFSGALTSGLAALQAGQEALMRAVGALAATRFASPFLLRERVPDPAQWATLIANFAGESIARRRPSRDDVARVPAHLARLRELAPQGGRVALLGDQALAVGYALAADPAYAVVVLQPGETQTVPADRPQDEGCPRVIGCADWAFLPAVMPPTDVLAVLDEHAGSYLMTAPMVLWHLAERTAAALLIAVPLGAEAGDPWRPRGDGSGFVFSDGFVRSALHEARFFEAADVATFADGLPLDVAPRLSRFTYRERLAHGRKFRFLDGEPGRAIEVPPGTRLSRWYVARKGMIATEDE